MSPNRKTTEKKKFPSIEFVNFNSVRCHIRLINSSYLLDLFAKYPIPMSFGSSKSIENVFFFISYKANVAKKDYKQDGGSVKYNKGFFLFA